MRLRHQRHSGNHLQLGGGVQVGLRRDYRSVAQPSPDPVQRVAADPRVVAALLGIQFRQC